MRKLSSQTMAQLNAASGNTVTFNIPANLPPGTILSWLNNINGAPATFNGPIRASVKEGANEIGWFEGNAGSFPIPPTCSSVDFTNPGAGNIARWTLSLHLGT